MDTNISPVMRIIAIAVLVLTPLVVVIFQRLEDIREINRKRQNGELDLSPGSFFPAGSRPNLGKPVEIICPQCHSSNPADHQYCGHCGAQLTPERENEK
jgi:hypothetical protein